MHTIPSTQSMLLPRSRKERKSNILLATLPFETLRAARFGAADLVAARGAARFCTTRLGEMTLGNPLL